MPRLGFTRRSFGEKGGLRTGQAAQKVPHPLGGSLDRQIRARENEADQQRDGQHTECKVQEDALVQRPGKAPEDQEQEERDLEGGGKRESEIDLKDHADSCHAEGQKPASGKKQDAQKDPEDEEEQEQ